jgi:hypothetical protein
MARQPSDPEKKTQESPQPQPEPTRLERAGEVIVELRPAPPTGPADKQIHPRRPLPLIPGAPIKPSKTENDKDK